MRILYSIAGEGMGHATRSKAVIDHLKKKHKIHITTSSHAYTYLSKHHKPITRVSCLHIAYKNNGVSPIGTLLVNLGNSWEHLKTIVKTYKLIRKFKPDVIVNDFAFTANYMGILLGIPVINLDNNRVAAKCRTKVPPKFWLSRFRAAFITNFIAPMGYHHIVTTFFYPPLRWWKNVSLCFSPIRKEIKRLKTRKGKHILVYQTTQSNKKLLDDMMDMTDQKFIIYGFGTRPSMKHMDFKPFSEKQFFKDLASAKAVIMNGGFTLMSECLYLKKPILSIPVKGQFEQELNAHYLDHLRYGKMLTESSVKGIRAFLKRGPALQKKLKKVKFNPDESLKILDKKLKEAKQLRS